MNEPTREPPNASASGSVDFGYEQVPREEKSRRVRAVFDSVADRYDLMNDLMSGGLHRLWKQFALSQTGLREGHSALDVAGGTGDLAAGMARQVGETGLVVLSDINALDARARPRPPARSRHPAQSSRRASRTPSGCRSATGPSIA